MKEVKISIRTEKDELPLIKKIKELAIKEGVNENQFIYRIKNVKIGGNK